MPYTQHIADGDAGAAAQRAEPGIGELPRRESVFGAGQIDIGLDAVDEIAVLPVEAGLDAAGDAGRLGRIVADRAPFVAERAPR